MKNQTKLPLLIGWIGIILFVSLTAFVGYQLLQLQGVSFFVENELGEKIQGATCELNPEASFGYPAWSCTTNSNGYCSIWSTASGDDIPNELWSYVCTCPVSGSQGNFPRERGNVVVYINMTSNLYPVIDGCYPDGIPTTTTTTTLPSCDPQCDTTTCHYGDVWCYDACGTRTYKQQECGVAGCSQNECVAGSTTTTTIPSCTSKGDCGTDGYVGDNYCAVGNVVRDYKEYNCYFGNCENSISTRLVEECSVGCDDGICTEEEESPILKILLIAGAGIVILVIIAVGLIAVLSKKKTKK